MGLLDLVLRSVREGYGVTSAGNAEIGPTHGTKAAPPHVGGSGGAGLDLALALALAVCESAMAVASSQAAVRIVESMRGSANGAARGYDSLALREVCGHAAAAAVVLLGRREADAADSESESNSTSSAQSVGSSARLVE